MHTFDEQDLRKIECYVGHDGVYYTVAILAMTRADFRKLCAQQNWTIRASHAGNIPEQKSLYATDAKGHERAAHFYIPPKSRTKRGKQYEIFSYSNTKRGKQYEIFLYSNTEEDNAM